MKLVRRAWSLETEQEQALLRGPRVVNVPPPPLRDALEDRRWVRRTMPNMIQLLHPVLRPPLPLRPGAESQLRMSGHRHRGRRRAALLERPQRGVLGPA